MEKTNHNYLSTDVYTFCVEWSRKRPELVTREIGVKCSITVVDVSCFLGIGGVRG